MKEKTEFPEAHTQRMETMLECMSVCVACTKKCIEEGHKKTALLCSECADICSMAIKAGSSHSEFEKKIMDLCAQVCKKCSEECKKVKAEHCQECSKICKRCSEVCS